ncbi:LuxR C-terminal-related transcriptional regulator [Butyrivibrio sp. MC2021]|uniref:LuxR C-terminal-related transcriptional regulator n=1 Tax=Butyrivibrio sp. MC2021 TaxID=1408306 RepID=UPI00047C992E|nr:LuxR C-terminal-related transcriptional regulator [Butyrivibrio sp. MC2021]
MPRKQSLSTTYIPVHLQKLMKQIPESAFTTVVAPMGYGKTTVINHFLEERAKKQDCSIIRISIYSDNLPVFWKSVQDAFRYEGYPFLDNYACPTDLIGGNLVMDAICRALAGEKDIYIFIDDFHLLSKGRLPGFLAKVADRLPPNIHAIIASRENVISDMEAIKLGRKACVISPEDLRLEREEIAAYVHRCGIDMSEEQLEELCYSTEGWFSAVYLCLRTYMIGGIIPGRDSDIYSVFTTAMIDSLPEDMRRFLIVMGLADEFSVEMAEFITNNKASGDILKKLAKQNAFVKKLPDSNNFRFHHMMKECTEKLFDEFDKEAKDFYRNRYGEWYEQHDQYIHAITSYSCSGNYDAILQVIQADAGILLSCWGPAQILQLLDNCPVEVLARYPLTILVLMRCLFNFRQIPKMLELRDLLQNVIENSQDIPPVEKGNLLGESDLIMSFLMFNDVTAMSRFHRSASEQMTRPAISITNKGGWTFGSPSVLMMFYRQPGDLEKELSEMDECMPHYYKVTNYHGYGAERIMRAEARYMQGDFVDAAIALGKAYIQPEKCDQDNMKLCCDFLDMRMNLFADHELTINPDDRKKEILKNYNAGLINIWNASCAYYYALLGDVEKVPKVFREHLLERVNILEPGRPMTEMIENSVYLAQQDYTKVLGRVDRQIAICERMNYCLVKIYLLIQKAACLNAVHKVTAAGKVLMDALELAQPDNLMMPFVENYEALEPLFDEVHSFFNHGQFIDRIKELSLVCRKRLEKNSGVLEVQVFSKLTAREGEVASLMAKRLTNHEIAEKLFLSEGSVKQYSNQIYYKLNIKGDTRTKRKRLLELLGGSE